MIFQRSVNCRAVGLRSPATETLDKDLLHAFYFRASATPLLISER